MVRSAHDTYGGVEAVQVPPPAPPSLQVPLEPSDGMPESTGAPPPLLLEQATSAIATAPDATAKLVESVGPHRIQDQATTCRRTIGARLWGHLHGPCADTGTGGSQRVGAGLLVEDRTLIRFAGSVSGTKQGLGDRECGSARPDRVLVVTG